MINSEFVLLDMIPTQGNIHVVIMVLGIIMVGIFSYLIILSSRLKKLERQIKQDE